MNVYKCEGCKLFEDKPGKLNPLKENDGDWIGWCHLNKGNLLILRSTYDLICYFGCASHSDFQNQKENGVYIITDEEMKKMLWCFYNGFFSDGSDIAAKVRSSPYNPQAEREKLLDLVYKRIYEESIGDPFLVDPVITMSVVDSIIEELHRKSKDGEQ